MTRCPARSRVKGRVTQTVDDRITGARPLPCSQRWTKGDCDASATEREQQALPRARERVHAFSLSRFLPQIRTHTHCGREQADAVALSKDTALHSIHPRPSFCPLIPFSLSPSHSLAVNWKEKDAFPFTFQSFDTLFQMI